MTSLWNESEVRYRGPVLWCCNTRTYRASYPSCEYATQQGSTGSRTRCIQQFLQIGIITSVSEIIINWYHLVNLATQFPNSSTVTKRFATSQELYGSARKLPNNQVGGYVCNLNSVIGNVTFKGVNFLPIISKTMWIWKLHCFSDKSTNRTIQQEKIYHVGLMNKKLV